MDSFKNHKKGTELEFSSYTGEVLDSNKYSETHVYSSGGGGTVNSGSGYVDGPTVHSSSSTVHEFWIKESNGIEKAISVSGYDIPLRAGQKITVIYAGQKGLSQYLWALVNHNAQKHWFLSKKGFEYLNRITFLGFLKFVTYPVIIFFLAMLALEIEKVVPISLDAISLNDNPSPITIWVLVISSFLCNFSWVKYPFSMIFKRKAFQLLFSIPASIGMTSLLLGLFNNIPQHDHHYLAKFLMSFTFIAGIAYGFRWIAKVIRFDRKFQKDLDEHLEKVIADTYNNSN